jgi:cytochrome P450
MQGVRHNRAGQPRGDSLSQFWRSVYSISMLLPVLTPSLDYSIGGRSSAALPLFGDGIFTQNGASWKHSRHELRELFQHKHYKSLEIFRRAVDELIHHLHQQPDIVDLQPLFFRLGLDTATTLIYGRSIHDLENCDAAIERKFAAAFDGAQKWVTRRLRLPSFLWPFTDFDGPQACRDVHRFVNLMAERDATQDTGEKKQATKQTVQKSQMVSLLAAARDTTASLLSWTL